MFLPGELVEVVYINSRGQRCGRWGLIVRQVVDRGSLDSTFRVRLLRGDELICSARDLRRVADSLAFRTSQFRV